LKIKIITNVILLVLAMATIFCDKKIDSEALMMEMFNKKNVKIVVTDSGLGGMSVAADLAARLPKSGVFQNAEIIFFNSLFHNKSGYNSLDSEDEKIRIFDIALNSMKNKYHPDLLLIACNTLSVLYDKTPFSKIADLPVIGIVATGVDLIHEQFNNTPQATAIIFATKTTVASQYHKKMLIDRGIDESQIVLQACHKLAGSIERGADSPETAELIRKYVNQAMSTIDADHSIFASLNCTHYGYSIEQFRVSFAEAGYPEVTIIDPNPEMADFLFDEKYLHRYQETKVSVKVVSKVSISDEKKDSLAPLIQKTSFAAAEALRNYRYDADLFDAKFDTTQLKD